MTLWLKKEFITDSWVCKVDCGLAGLVELGWRALVQAAGQLYMAPNSRLGCRQMCLFCCLGWLGNSCLEKFLLMRFHWWTKRAAWMTGFFQTSAMPCPLIFSLAKPKVKGQEVYSTHHEAIARMLMNNSPWMMWRIENSNSLGNLNKLIIKSPHINWLPSLVTSFLWLPRPCLLHHRWAKLPRGQYDPPKWKRNHFSFGRFCPIYHMPRPLHCLETDTIMQNNGI